MNSQELPHGWKQGDLRLYLEDRLIGLNAGDLPEWVTLDQAAYVMAMAIDGRAIRDAMGKALTFLREQNRPGRAPWLDSGRKTTALNTLFVGSLSPSKRLGTNGLSREDAVLLVSLRDLGKLVQLFDAEGYRSKLLSLMLGANTCNESNTPEVIEDDDLPADVVGATSVPLPAASKLLGRFLAGGAKQVTTQHRNRGATDRSNKPYLKAFNDDGTINCPDFYRIAKGRGELSGSAGAVSLSKVVHRAR